MNNSQVKKNLANIEINIVVLTILFYLFRTTVPFFKFPFLVLFFGLLVFSIINYRIHIRPTFKVFFSSFYLSIFLAIILIISFLFSNKLYLIVFKDTVNAIILLLLFFLMVVYIKSKSDLELFLRNFIHAIIFFSILISVLLLFNFFNIFSCNEDIASNKLVWSSLIVSLSSDYNFALLPVIFGMFCVFYLLIEPIPIPKKVVLNLILVIYSITIIFSGSRRGLFVLAGIIVILIFMQLITFNSKDSLYRKIGNSSKCYVLIIIILTTLLVSFVFFLPGQMKRNTLNALRIDIRSYKNIVSTQLFKYSNIFHNYKYENFKHDIWPEKPDSKDPDSGWGTKISKLVFPLSGENVNIVPKNSTGYLMDSTCNSETWNNNAYSYTNISSLFQCDSITEKNELYYASVYCFVSKDFNGNWAAISDRDGVSGDHFQEYDLNKRGTWQKLEICFNAESVIPVVFLYWSKYGVRDFSSLKGYLIFAYPQYIVTKKDSVSSLIIDPLKSKTRNSFEDSIKEYNKTNLSRGLIKRFNGIEDLYSESSNLRGEYRSIYKPNLNANTSIAYQYKASLSPGIFLLTILLSTGIDEDPIRKWVSKLISEDTTYYNYKKELLIDTISNNFIAERIYRWQFTWEIFTKEYNLKQKIFGGGFNFLNWYGYFFLKDKTASDWPHNPFLAVLLYSGIIGLILYVFLIYKVFYYYFKYFKNYYLFFIFFLITFFFSFFSSSSPFDPPIMGFFIMLPFFIHSFYKNESEQTIFTK